MSFHGFSQNWSLTGNSGTNPSIDFLGTTDNTRLVFRTDSIERATILANGNFGIGTSSPQGTLHVFSNSAGGQLQVSGNTPAIVMYAGSVPSGLSNGQIGWSTAANDFVAGAQIGDFILSNYDTAHSLIFGTGQATGDGIERMRINKIGYIGIDKASPTARLDVNCVTLSGQTNPSNIRFENLQAGTGTALMIDSNGYVYKATTASPAVAAQATPLVTDMQSQVQALQSQVQELRSLLATSLCLTQSQTNSLNAESSTYLGEIYPNPANTSTTLAYSLPPGAGTALLQVYSLDGKVVSSVVLPAAAGKSQVQLATSQMAAGMYIYALVVDGKVLDSKKLAVVR